MAREFTATLAWKPSRGSTRSSAGVASSRMKPAIAARSSEAVGRSWAMSGSALQELQEIHLGLDGTPPDRGEFHRCLGAGKMLPRLRMADDAPAHRAEDLPPVRARRIDLVA